MSCSPAERSLIDIIIQPADAGESPVAAQERKELELTSVIAQLPVLDVLKLHRRLLRAAVGDPVVEAFQRLVAECRFRLIAFIARTSRRTGTRLRMHA